MVDVVGVYFVIVVDDGLCVQLQCVVVVGVDLVLVYYVVVVCFYQFQFGIDQ